MNEMIGFGIAGGILSNFLRVIVWGQTPQSERPVLFSDFGFYLQFVGLAMLGGFFVFLYQRTQATFTPLLAVHIGASAPILAQQLISSAPAVGKVG